jgi:hypothetical protein
MAMGSSLAEEFWVRFAVLLVAVFGMVVVLTAACDTLAVRILSRRLPPWSRPSAEAAPVPDAGSVVNTTMVRPPAPVPDTWVPDGIAGPRGSREPYARAAHDRAPDAVAFQAVAGGAAGCRRRVAHAARRLPGRR